MRPGISQLPASLVVHERLHLAPEPRGAQLLGRIAQRSGELRQHQRLGLRARQPAEALEPQIRGRIQLARVIEVRVGVEVLEHRQHRLPAPVHLDRDLGVVEEPPAPRDLEAERVEVRAPVKLRHLEAILVEDEGRTGVLAVALGALHMRIQRDGAGGVGEEHVARAFLRHLPQPPLGARILVPGHRPPRHRVAEQIPPPLRLDRHELLEQLLGKHRPARQARELAEDAHLPLRGVLRVGRPELVDPGLRRQHPPDLRAHLLAREVRSVEG